MYLPCKGELNRIAATGTSDSKNEPWCGMTAQENSCLPAQMQVDQRKNTNARQYVRTLILLGIRGRRCAQKRYTQNVAAAREAILRLREDGNAIAELAQVRVLPETR